ncbi:MAG: 5-oxoprolinase subunit PxpB [Chloroflexi bacterium]|nr:5-oxoprolinase subunit PxpB [Chloroflexota bacterium]
MNWPRYQPVGDSALAVAFGDEIAPALNRRVHALARLLDQDRLPGFCEAVPTYCALLIHYDPLLIGYQNVVDWVAAKVPQIEAATPASPRRLEIPVLYNGPDLAFVAEYNHLTVEEVIAIHSGEAYTVYMMGFTPGFPYMGRLPPAIITPRLETPRTRVPAGSVGIAGPQTGIYPIESPGGWRIIGQTRLKLFDLSRDPPFLFAPGDVVRFTPVYAESA